MDRTHTIEEKRYMAILNQTALSAYIHIYTRYIRWSGSDGGDTDHNACLLIKAAGRNYYFCRFETIKNNKLMPDIVASEQFYGNFHKNLNLQN
jgi:hypothetical protein